MAGGQQGGLDWGQNKQTRPGAEEVQGSNGQNEGGTREELGQTESSQGPQTEENVSKLQRDGPFHGVVSSFFGDDPEKFGWLNFDKIIFVSPPYCKNNWVFFKYTLGKT